jgi:hypothetical protein
MHEITICINGDPTQINPRNRKFFEVCKNCPNCGIDPGMLDYDYCPRYCGTITCSGCGSDVQHLGSELALGHSPICQIDNRMRIFLVSPEVMQCYQSGTL